MFIISACIHIYVHASYVLSLACVSVECCRALSARYIYVWCCTYMFVWCSRYIYVWCSSICASSRRGLRTLDSYAHKWKVIHFFAYTQGQALYICVCIYIYVCMYVLVQGGEYSPSRVHAQVMCVAGLFDVFYSLYSLTNRMIIFFILFVTP